MVKIKINKVSIDSDYHSKQMARHPSMLMILYQYVMSKYHCAITL